MTTIRSDRQWKARDIDEAKDAMHNLVQSAMRRDGQRAPIVIRIPPQECDADIVLEDVIEELAALRAVRDAAVALSREPCPEQWARLDAALAAVKGGG
jgi:SH3-like domain-containing protein